MSTEKLTPQILDELLNNFTKRPEDERIAAIKSVISGIAGNHTLKTVSVDVFTDVMLNNNMSSWINLLALTFVMGQQHALTVPATSVPVTSADASYNMLANGISEADKDFLKNLKISLDTPEDLK